MGDLPSGTTLRLLLWQCADRTRLGSHRAVAPLVAEAVRACDMVPLEQVGHDFPGEGFSLCVILAESHLALHTYPERSRSVVVELSVCDHLRPNRERAFRLAARLVELFKPARYVLEPGSMRPVGEEHAGPTAAHNDDD